METPHSFVFRDDADIQCDEENLLHDAGERQESHYSLLGLCTFSFCVILPCLCVNNHIVKCSLVKVSAIVLGGNHRVNGGS